MPNQAENGCCETSLTSPSNVGRPTIWTEGIAEEILSRHAAGESLVCIGRDARMPARRTIQQWASDDREGFRADLAHAHELYAEWLVFDAGRQLQVTDAELVELKGAASAAVHARKSRSEWAMKIAGCMDRARWGDRQQLDINGHVTVGTSFKSTLPEHVIEAIARENVEDEDAGDGAAPGQQPPELPAGEG